MILEHILSELASRLICNNRQRRRTQRQLFPIPDANLWEMVWNDEFDGTELDEGKWDVPADERRRDGWWMRRVVSLDGKGNLVLRTLKEGNRYISGCVRTKGKFEHTFGYYTARIRLPNQAGHWSTFGLFNDAKDETVKDDLQGTEVEIYEKPWDDDRIQHTYHWTDCGKEDCSAQEIVRVPRVAEDWHTFSLLWSPDQYIFFVDGEETWRTRIGGICQKPLYIMLSDEVGTWSGDISKAKLPDEFLIDYVRVYDMVENRSFLR